MSKREKTRSEYDKNCSWKPSNINHQILKCIAKRSIPPSVRCYVHVCFHQDIWVFVLWNWPTNDLPNFIKQIIKRREPITNIAIVNVIIDDLKLNGISGNMLLSKYVLAQYPLLSVARRPMCLRNIHFVFYGPVVYSKIFDIFVYFVDRMAMIIIWSWILTFLNRKGNTLSLNASKTTLKEELVRSSW